MIKCQQNKNLAFGKNLVFRRLKMIHSLLIVNGTAEERQGKAIKLAENWLGKSIVNHPDFLFFEETDSLKISHVRELQKRLVLKPYLAPVKVALISEAEKLTLPAQHALLKTLEEPPSHSIIILSSPTKEALLPTIVSRCQIIQLPTANQKMEPSFLASHLSLLKQILSSSPGERLLLAENYVRNRDQALQFCQNQLIILREVLRQRSLSTTTNHQPLTTSHLVFLLHQIQRSLVLLKANVNPSLVVENLLLFYPF